jgi:hypothetical protein
VSAKGASRYSLLGRCAGLFADKLLTCAAEIALGESIGIGTDSRRGSRGKGSRRIVDAAAALAHARRGVAVHHTAGKGLELRLDRGQRGRYRRDRDGLLRKSNRRKTGPYAGSVEELTPILRANGRRSPAFRRRSFARIARRDISSA